MRDIDDELESLAKNVPDNPDDKRSPSREDFDRISRIATDSPIVNNQGVGSLGKKTIESFKEIERNRQLHLAKQGLCFIEYFFAENLLLDLGRKSTFLTQFNQTGNMRPSYTNEKQIVESLDHNTSNWLQKKL